MRKLCYFFILIVLASPVFSQVWQKISAMPGVGRDASITFTIGNKLYSGGGSNKDFYEYDPASGLWTKKASIPGVSTNRSFATGFSINGKGYVGMGTDQDISVLKKDLWEYDPVANTWTQKSDFPGGGRDGLGVFVINNKAYIGGGSDNNFLFMDFYEYDPAQDKWTQKNDLSSGYTIFPAMFSIGNYGYLTCGAGQTEFNDLLRYDPATDSWDNMSSFPEDSARQAGVAFVINGKGYVGLGMKNYDTVFTVFYSYDPQKDHWSKVSNMPGKGRAWATAGVVGNKAYIGEGWDFVDNFNSDWWSFDPVATAGVTQNSATEAVTCFPEPASSFIRLHGLAADKNFMAVIYDQTGRNVLNEKVSGGGPELQISSLAAGMYELLLKDETGACNTMHFIKQ